MLLQSLEGPESVMTQNAPGLVEKDEANFFGDDGTEFAK
jgi:hypothetical protein